MYLSSHLGASGHHTQLTSGRKPAVHDTSDGSTGCWEHEADAGGLDRALGQLVADFSGEAAVNITICRVAVAIRSLKHQHVAQLEECNIILDDLHNTRITPEFACIVSQIIL